MSDRMAVFNSGRIEQIGAPADVYEQPATPFVAGFVGTSNLLRGAVAEAIVGGAGTFTVRPEKIRLADPAATVAADESVAPGHIRERRLPRARHPLHRRPRRRRRARRHPAEPGHIVDRGTRRAGQGGPAHLEAAALPPHRGRRIRRRGGGTSMRSTRMMRAGAVAAVIVAGLSGSGERRAERGRECAAASRRRAGRGPSSAAAPDRRHVTARRRRGRRSTSWPGRATSRTASTDPA